MIPSTMSTRTQRFTSRANCWVCHVKLSIASLAAATLTVEPVKSVSRASGVPEYKTMVSPSAAAFVNVTRLFDTSTV